MSRILIIITRIKIIEANGQTAMLDNILYYNIYIHKKYAAVAGDGRRATGDVTHSVNTQACNYEPQLVSAFANLRFFYAAVSLNDETSLMYLDETL